MKYTTVFLFCILIATESLAGIRSLGGNGSSSSRSHNAQMTVDNIQSAPIVNLKNKNTSQECKNAGFTFQSCPAGYVPVYECPQNKKYFRDCCPQEYRHTESFCRERGMEPSVETCLGFHACRPKNAGMTNEQREKN